jgi:hypothetical protein
MHLPVGPRTMVQNPAELRERANQSHAAASARTPAAGQRRRWNARRRTSRPRNK